MAGRFCTLLCMPARISDQAGDFSIKFLLNCSYFSLKFYNSRAAIILLAVPFGIVERARKIAMSTNQSLLVFFSLLQSRHAANSSCSQLSCVPSRLSRKRQQCWKIALARSPMRVSEALGGWKSTITRPYGEYDFQFYVIIQSALFKYSCRRRCPTNLALKYKFVLRNFLPVIIYGARTVVQLYCWSLDDPSKHSEGGARGAREKQRCLVV